MNRIFILYQHPPSKSSGLYCSTERAGWFLNGEYHNDNGPAIVYNDGTCEWWLFVLKINCSSQDKFLKYKKYIAFL